MRLEKEEKETLIKATRQGLYLAILIGVTYFMHGLAKIFKTATFSENGIVENMQIGVLLFAGILFSIKAILDKKMKNVCLLCASMCVLACFRELDKVFDEILPIISWKIGYIFPITGLVYSLKHFDETQKGLVAFLNSPAFMMCCGALIVICPGGQLIGHKSFVQNVLGMENVSSVKELFEEAAETVGYFLLVLASVETFFIKKSSSK